MHSSKKPGFFPHRFLDSFSNVLDTKLNGKLNMKKLHFRFEGARTLKIVAETESKIHVFILTFDIVKFLLDKNANIKAKDVYGNTLLHIATRYSSKLKIVKFFLDKNTNNMKNVNNLSRIPLYKGVKGNKLNTVKFLLGKSANIEVQDTFSETPLVMATQESYINIVEALQHPELVLERQLFTEIG